MANNNDGDALLRRACFSFHAMGATTATCALTLLYYADRPDMAILPGIIALAFHSGAGLLWLWSPDTQAEETTEKPQALPKPAMITFDGEKVVAFPLGRARMSDPAKGPENGTAEVVNLESLRPAPRHHAESDAAYALRIKNFDPNYDPSPC